MTNRTSLKRLFARIIYDELEILFHFNYFTVQKKKGRVLQKEGAKFKPVIWD
jgi:hypothetical protein